MSSERVIVLDANILIRACLGSRVFELLKKYEDSVTFYTPDICYLDAERHIPTIFSGRRLDVNEVLAFLGQLRHIVHPVDIDLYREHEKTARRRIADRDPADWPVVAVALLLRCPIWTEDQDFFGTGLPTWTTRRVEEYLEGVQ